MKKVITYGTYDLFHQGHYNLLKRAKALGDYLIVGVTSDYFDKSRGKFNVRDDLMTRIVKKTGFADKIVVEEYFGQKIDDIKKYGIDIFTVGSDWKGYFDYLNEYCKVVYLERTKGISSTQIRNEHSVRLGIVGNEMAGGYAPKDDVDSKYKSVQFQQFPQYDAYESLLDDVDAVYINAPLIQRDELIATALEKGKHVLTEFPFSFNYPKARDFVKIASEKGLVLIQLLER